MTVAVQSHVLLERIDAAKSVRQLKIALVDFLPYLHIKHAAYCGVPPLEENDTGNWIVLVTYPDSWVRHYTNEDYFRTDPVIQTTMKEILPVDWRDLRHAHPQSQKIMEEAQGYGIGHQGVAFPIRGPYGDFALFNVTSDLDDEAWRDLKSGWISHWQELGYYLHRRLFEISGSKIYGGLAKLSPRETEALELTSRGLSSDAVAEEMKISERVVRAHLATCRLKLNALNTTHAVARAVRLHLISI
ncbi:helix-turn-helix transcriptional regulator [Alsobacter sp. SYSU BS001988]|jgi:DNA-binding CsgD family transcriptional regulator